MPDDLTSTVGIIALASAALALIAFALAAILALKLKRLRSAQAAVLGATGERDLVAHAESLEHRFEELRAFVEDTFNRLDRRLTEHDGRLERCVSRSAVIRYDAYGEMSGHQSSSMALLDDTGSGVVLSSILHREQARMYVKGVRNGRSELELSPEENEAIRNALGGESGLRPDSEAALGRSRQHSGQ